MKMVVYALIHSRSGHYYIGSTANPTKRFRQWICDLEKAREWCPTWEWRLGSRVPKKFFSFGWEPIEWTLCELKTIYGSDRTQIRALERAEIERAYKVNPGLLLNARTTTHCWADAPAAERYLEGANG